MAKKAALWIAVAFAVFYLLSAPTHAAGFVKSAGVGLRHAATQLLQFARQFL